MDKNLIKPIQCDNWDMTLKRFEAWWNNKSIGRPMMRVVAKRDEPLSPLEEEMPFVSHEDNWMNLDRKLLSMRNKLKTHRFMAEAYPELNFNMGAGSLAAYMGGTPIFQPETIWYNHCLDDVSDLKGMFDMNNKWLQRQLSDMKIAQECALKEGYFIAIPDIIENLDIYSALRGAEDACFDLMDYPEIVEKAVKEIDDIYFPVYDAFKNTVKRPDNLTSYTEFHLLGENRVAKIQCDFSAMMSPNQFREFALPSLKKQFEGMDRAIYHLDGPDAVRHLDAVLEIPQVRAIQWEGGAGAVVSGSKEYYPIYDRIKEANRALHMFLNFGTLPDWIETIDRIVDRYGNQGIYFLLEEMSMKDAEYIMEYADKHWTSRD